MSEPPVVGALIETFTSMLADKVVQEVSLITGFKNDFEYLCDELVDVKNLLDEVGQNSTSRTMSNWLEKLEYFLIDAVDIVDECRASKFSKSIFSNFEKLIFRYKMGSRMRTLRERIKNIHRSAKYLKHLMSVLQVNALNAHNLEDKRERSRALLKESHIVGIEEEIDKITKFILMDKGPQVIAVVGMGGMGKTFLVDCVIKSQKVHENFDHVVWLEVPRNFDMPDMLRRIKKKMKIMKTDDTVRNPNPMMDDSRGKILEEVENNLLEELKRSRCLFVLDDIWKKDDFNQFDWLMGKTKIVITTRDKGVVSNMSPDQQLEVYELKKLSSENSKKLFCIHAFPDHADTDEPPKELTQHITVNTDIQPPKELMAVTNKIVEKCGGLPLALKTIGAFMARKKRLPNAWESILKSLNEAEAMSDKVWASLRLSYENLPYHLKLCFDYCSCFPKNSRIKSEYLVNAWIDEGFIPGTAEFPYDVGLSYINELIDRCLLEVSKVGGDGTVKYCKMHEIFYDIALSESHKKTKCLLNPGKDLAKFPEGELGLRRISLIENNISGTMQPIKCQGLRTLLLCNNVNLTISTDFFNGMKYLAVLDLSGTSIKSLPENIKHLKHLKLLNLSGTKIDKLPKSLAELRSLHFLDVSNCKRLSQMHSGIDEHKSILHLNVKGSDKLESLPVGISKLIHLHTLKGPLFKMEKAPTGKVLPCSVVLKKGKRANAKAMQWWNLKSLTLLQHLSFTLNAPSSPDGIIRLEKGTFGSMENMRALSIKYIDSSEGAGGILHLPDDIKDMRRLEILHLKSCALQKWIFGLENLMELELYGDNGSTSAYRGLENIPNLRKLKFSSNDKCIEFPEEFGKSGAFPKLDNFVIKRFIKMENFPSLHHGALPMLKRLQLKYCYELKNIPEALQRPTTVLEEIRVKGCPELEKGIWKDKVTWQLFNNHPIKLTINGYTISWALDQMNNSKLYRDDFQRKTLRSNMLKWKAAVLFAEAGTSSAGGVAVDRTLQNASRQEQITMDEHKEKSVAGVVGMKKGESVSSSNGDEIPNKGKFQAQTDTVAAE